VALKKPHQALIQPDKRASSGKKTRGWSKKSRRKKVRFSPVCTTKQRQYSHEGVGGKARTALLGNCEVGRGPLDDAEGKNLQNVERKSGEGEGGDGYLLGFFDEGKKNAERGPNRSQKWGRTLRCGESRVFDWGAWAYCSGRKKQGF